MKKREVLLIVFILTVVLASGVFWKYKTSQKTIGTYKPPVITSSLDDKSCNTDEDCVITWKVNPENPCCPDNCQNEAVNKRAEKAREEWRAENCSGAECPLYDCYNPQLPIPRCINNQCVIEWVER